MTEFPKLTGYDLIGDVHGCYSELLELLGELGYGYAASGRTLFSSPADRMLVFVGDLNDRGPDSASVLNLVMLLCEYGIAATVLGNHEYKLYRLMRRVAAGELAESNSKSLMRTYEQITSWGDEFSRRVYEFLESLKYVYEAPTFRVVHGAFREYFPNSSTPVSEKYAKQLALYGETTGKKDEDGYPERLNLWKRDYRDSKHVIHGHIPVLEPDESVTSSGAKIVDIDTGCVFGGKLTALRLPEWQYVSVPAKAAYHPHKRFGGVENVASSSS